MPRHASTCLCEGCERDGTGELADREAAALARSLGCDDAALQARLFLALTVQREGRAQPHDGAPDLAGSLRALAVARAPI